MKLVFLFSAIVLVSSAFSLDLKKLGNLDDGLALHGYDAVTYFTEKKPLKGKKEIALERDGAKYLFASDENRKKFEASPEKFEAAYGGWCAYAMADGEKVDVDPETYKIVDGKILLFYNGWLGNTLKKWNPKEAELKPKADGAWRKIAEGK